MIHKGIGAARDAVEPALFSVVTVVRDDLAGLVRTHASLEAQQCRDFEWIVVDGDSRDGSRDWLEANRSRIGWWRSAPDGGIYDAMNIGLGVASGRYVLFLNAGDALAEAGTLAAVATALAGAGWPDFCYGDAFETGPGGRLLLKPARSHRRVWYGMFTHHQAMFCRRAILAGLAFNPAYPVGADYAFTIEVLGRARSHHRVSRPVCIFAPGGCSQRMASSGRRDQSLIRKSLLKHSIVRRWLIHALQLIVYNSRKYLPHVFCALRYRDRFDMVNPE